MMYVSKPSGVAATVVAMVAAVVVAIMSLRIHRVVRISNVESQVLQNIEKTLCSYTLLSFTKCVFFVCEI